MMSGDSTSTQQKNINPNKVLDKRKRRQIETEHKHIKITKSNLKNKAYILSA